MRSCLNLLRLLTCAGLLLCCSAAGCAPPDKVSEEDDARRWPTPKPADCVDWRTAQVKEPAKSWTIDPTNPCRVRGDAPGVTSEYGTISVFAPVNGPYVYAEALGDWDGYGTASIQLWQNELLVSERSAAIVGNKRLIFTSDFIRLKPQVTALRVTLRVYSQTGDKFSFRLDADGLKLKPVTEIEAKQLAPNKGRIIVNGRVLRITDPAPDAEPSTEPNEQPPA